MSAEYADEGKNKNWLNFEEKKVIDIYVTSAFCKNNNGGNKAGVVLEGDNLTSVQKQEIAKELQYSETAFVSNSGVADLKLSYFTPTEEVPLCGHATIATFSTLYQLNMLKKEKYTIETKAGILNIQVRSDGMIFMEQNRPTYFEKLDAKILPNCIGKHLIDGHLPIQIVSTGLKDIMLPIESVEQLRELQPDFAAIGRLSKEKGVVGIHAFVVTKGADTTAVCRNFAPLYGIKEESATGTSNCALACYLFKYYEKKTQYVFEQGHNLGEVSRIIVEIVYHGEEIDSVYVGGYGYVMCKRTLLL